MYSESGTTLNVASGCARGTLVVKMNASSMQLYGELLEAFSRSAFLEMGAIRGALAR